MTQRLKSKIQKLFNPENLRFKAKLFFIAFYYAFRHPRKFWNALSARGKKWALRILIFVLIISIAVPVSFWYRAKTAQAAWWDENWAYRKNIPVTNNTSQESNVYISVTVDTSDTNKFQTDCGDIRFTTLRGQILPYYIVSGCGTNSTVIHVNFETFPSGAQTIYMYYGNPSAPNGFSANDFSTQASNYSIGSLGSEERGPGPVAYWKFDEGQGTTAQDATVNNLDGTISGATWKTESECVSGKCLEFKGNDDVTVSGINSLISDWGATKYTINVWIMPKDVNTDRAIFGYYSINDIVQMRLNPNSNSKLGVYMRGTSNCGWVESQNALQTNRWYFATMVYDQSTLSLYLDGKLQNSTSCNITSVNLSGFYVGYNGLSNRFRGFMDEVKIYPYARTADQIKQDYNAGLAGQSTNTGTAASIGSDSPKWMTDGLVGWWKMDETSGTTVADASGNGNNGTLTNAQETGTAETESTTTAVVDADNSALSTTDDAYNNMILRVTGGTGCGITAGTERTIQDYTGSTRTFTVAAYSAEADNCTFEVRHQTGGKFGNGVGFDAHNDYVNAGNGSVLNISGAITIACWIKVDSFTKTWQAIVTKGDSSWRLHRMSSYDKVAFGTSGLSQLDLSSTSSVNDGKWHHVAAVYGGSADSHKYLYIDGRLDASVYASGSISMNSYSVAIGENLQATNRNFDGLIDDVRIYNRALSPDEVRQLYEWGPGPVGWWKMDDNVSGNSKTIVDSSGNGNNGTTSWGTNASGMDCTKQGKYGRACEFDGVDDYVNLGNSSTLNPRQISISVLIKEGELPESYAGVVARGWAGSYMMDEQIDGSIRFRVSTLGGQCSVFTGTISNRNEWHHVEGTYDGVTVKIYLDGVLKNTCNLTDYLSGSSSNTLIGYAQATYNFPGLIDDVRIYNYARTPKQIIEDMNAGHPVGGSPIGSPVAHYKLDEGYGTTSQDNSQNNQDLTLVNTPAWTNSGKFGRALDFEKDSSQYGYSADSAALSITSDLTITGWIKPESVTSSTLFDIAGKWDGTNESYLLALYGDELRMYIDSSSNYKTTSSANLQAGTMYHVAGVYQASSQTVTLYVNGVEQSGSITGTIPASVGDDSGRFHLGAEDSSTTAANFFDGIIDEVKIYNSVLTPDQIALDMNQGKSVQFGGQTSATGATGQAAEYCVPGDTSYCAPPVGEWKFDEKTGGTVNDVSGNGNNGTWYGTGTHWTRGKYGSAGSFNGTNDYVNAGTNSILNITGNITLEAWVKPNTLSQSSNPEIISKGESAIFYRMRFMNGGIMRFNAFGTSDSYLDSASSLSAGLWNHVAMTYDGNYKRIYLNGILDSSEVTTGAMASSPNEPLWLGGFSSSEFFNGQIDDVKIYNYARTPAQIAWDYNRGKPIAHWKFDEGEGTSAYDSSGNGNTGTLTNMDPPNDWVDGKFGKALDFDGSNDYVSIPNSSFYNSYPLSITAWIKFTTQAGIQRGVVNKYVGASYNGYQLYVNNADICAWYYKDSSNYINSGGACSLPVSGYNDNNWHHVSFVVDSSGGRIYVDGVLKNSRAWTGSPGACTTSQPVWIGRYDSLYFSGQIDDVRIYNYALTEEQIRQVMNEGSVIRFGN